jgi:hypothetical protein
MNQFDLQATTHFERALKKLARHKERFAFDGDGHDG